MNDINKGYTSALPVQEYTPPAEARVYVVSKRKHAARLLHLRKEFPGVYFTARWPLSVLQGSEELRPASQYMEDNFDDIQRSGYVLAYVEDGEHLKHGLTELGYATAWGKQIWLVGWKQEEGSVEIHEDFAKLRLYKKLVHVAKDLPTALTEILRHAKIAAKQVS